MFTLKKKNYIISLIGVFILGAVFCFAVMSFTGTGKASGAHDFTRYERLSELERYLKDNYYTNITDSAITTGLYKGLFSSAGDPYTTYLTKDEYEDLSNQTHGDNSGIGVVMQEGDDTIDIIQVVDGAPAEAAGIKTGDKLVAVNGEAFDESQTGEAAAKVRGKAGTDVRITVLRGGKELEFTITRDNFTTPSVSSKSLSGNIGYINISTFNDNTTEDFEKALKKFEDEKAKGLIIDIRNNVGGLVSQGVDIADLLLDEAEIAYAENNKKERETYETKDGRTRLPYVLLVNKNSASTSEILAVGIKDNKGGYLVGEKTYGKGIIQKLEKFDEGDGARVTIMQYFSKAGKPIHNVGIKPDYEVKLSDDSKTDTQLEKARSLLTK